ncbi:MAG: hypothetical protein AB1489_20205 [Acidobacteriota bacterium]
MGQYDDEESTTGAVELTALREFLEKNKQRQELRRTGEAHALVSFPITIDLAMANKLDNLVANGYATSREAAVTRLLQTYLDRVDDFTEEEDPENLYFGG